MRPANAWCLASSGWQGHLVGLPLPGDQRRASPAGRADISVRQHCRGGIRGRCLGIVRLDVIYDTRKGRCVSRRPHRGLRWGTLPPTKTAWSSGADHRGRTAGVNPTQSTRLRDEAAAGSSLCAGLAGIVHTQTAHHSSSATSVQASVESSRVNRSPVAAGRHQTRATSLALPRLCHLNRSWSCSAAR